MFEINIWRGNRFLSIYCPRENVQYRTNKYLWSARGFQIVEGTEIILSFCQVCFFNNSNCVGHFFCMFLEIYSDLMPQLYQKV